MSTEKGKDMKRKLLISALVGATLMLAACGAPATTEQGAEPKTQAEPTAQTQEKPATNASAEASVPTKEHPLVVDKANKTVKIYALVNEKFKDESTMHMVASSHGSQGKNAMFISEADALDFHDALESLGLKAGNNVTGDTAGKVQVEGDALDVQFQFDGNDKSYTVSEVVDDSSKQDIDIRFGGNYDTQKELKTGCISCMMSCPAGISSNHTHMLGADEKDGISFTLNKDTVPADKTPVIISFIAK